MTDQPSNQSMTYHVRTGKILMHSTKWASNHNWCYRGSNTKSKEQK